MQIILKELSLENFKGSGKNTLNFYQETNIYGANGTGKTTLNDAFTWLLFGKDSNDKKDFSIKPLDIMGKTSDKLEIEVSAIMEIDGYKTVIKRNFREKWVKKRGEETPEFGGNETVFSWNEVPLSQKEFQDKVSGVMSENIFKIVTNPLYFNTLKWQDKRSILISIVGGQSDLELCNNIKYKELCTILESGKTLEEFKKELSSKTKKLRDEMKIIPSRIDEASKSIKEVESYNLEARISAKTSEFQAIEDKIKDESKAQKAEQDIVISLQKQAFEIEKNLQKAENQIEIEIKKEWNDRNTKIHLKQNEIDSLCKIIENGKELLNTKVKAVTDLELSVKSLREEFIITQQKTLEFDEDSFICPTCKRVHEDDDIENQKAQMLINFNEDKSKKCAKIRAEGLTINQKIEKLNQENESKNQSILEQNEKFIHLKSELNELENDKIKDLAIENDFQLEEALVKSKEYQELKRVYEDLSIEIHKRPSQEEISNDYEESKANLKKEIDNLKSLNVQISLNKVQESRIQELQKEMSSYGAELNKLEKMEFLLQEFTKDKISNLEEKVNSKFDFVNFKMFDTQINGGETETCEILVNGVPFNDANTAGKAVAGIDIINTLSEHYKCFAPIWIDNRESVTAIQPTKSQIINLFVSPEHKKITVNDISNI